MRKGHILLTVLLSVGVSAATVKLMQKSSRSNHTVASSDTPSNNDFLEINNQKTSRTHAGFDFREASAKSTQSVVFIKTEGRAPARSSFWFFDLDPFGSIGKVASTGSGVIISPDGYIVTNHHVIKNADKIEVVLNQPKRTYVAQVVGKAQSSDLALLKIDAENLPEISIGNSDELLIGDWVLAVGNPFNLTSTVTAGIVSAKGRNINLVNNEFPIESFIHTDAAINPGNSGGALVDQDGNLVGINTAIASRTGSYVGYGFAIPSNLVVKIVNDLKEFGQIQSGYDGLEVVELDEQTAKNANLDHGVLVAKVTGTNDEAAKLFEEHDILLNIDSKEITDVSGYKEILANQRPGDAIRYKVLREGSEQDITLKLVNKEGTYELLAQKIVFSEKLGADLEMISKLERMHYGVGNGIKVTNIRAGELQKMGITDGFIFLAVNKVSVSSIDNLVKNIEQAKGRLQIEGIDQNGRKRFLSFYIY
jgi:S1-C subfamily serine protease